MKKNRIKNNHQDIQIFPPGSIITLLKHDYIQYKIVSIFDKQNSLNKKRIKLDVKRYELSTKNFMCNSDEDFLITVAKVPPRHKFIIDYRNNTVQLSGPKCKQHPLKVDLEKWKERKKFLDSGERILKYRKDYRTQNRDKNGRFTK